MKKYPIGLQDFESIIQDKYIYVDKTEYIFKLLFDAKYYFLSRPRRFGKSLLLNTLKEIFLGKKELFKGLFIEDKIEWKAYPVIKLDFSAIDCIHDFRYGIEYELKLIYKQYNLSCGEEKSIGILFRDLIIQLSQKEKVVILIDEYDKPILHFLGVDNAKSHENRLLMRELYSVLKSLDAHIKFLFITGITRFSKTSLFSDLNNLQDITINPTYSTICGYTQQEIEHYFAEGIQEIADYNELELEACKEKIKLWYNGYRWAKKAPTVYNSFSFLIFLSEKEFDNYWFNTGLPTFLINVLNANEEYDFNEVIADTTLLNNFDIDHINSITLLFQAGYLTIKDRNEEVFTLVYPNKEVKQALLQSILNNKSNIYSGLTTILGLKKMFESGDLSNLKTSINALFAQIPHQLFLKKSEAYYHSILVVAFQLLGCQMQSEVSVASGRIDALVQTDKFIYIIEFKVNKSSDKAIAQIENNHYQNAYLASGKKVISVGISFKEKEIDNIEIKEA